MKVIYTGQKIDSGKSCFLAGPTPRDKGVKSWRSDAIEIFKELNFTGSLYIPEFPEKLLLRKLNGIKKLWKNVILLCFGYLEIKIC